MSFFDDDEETAPRPSARAPRRGPGGGSAGITARARTATPRPRRPQHRGAGVDRQTLMMRRAAGAVALVVLVLVIVLVISSILKSEKRSSLKSYARSVSALATESDAHVSGPLFKVLAGAGGKPALDVEEEVAGLRGEAQALASRAKGLSVPGEMAAAQRDLLLTFDLRVEGMSKLAELLPSAYGDQAKQTGPKIAGDMEIFLASDVVYSQRVAPLIEQTLSDNGIHDVNVASTRFVSSVGWLESSTVLSHLGQTSATQGTVAAGHHGSLLKGVSVGTSALEAEPAVNHISGGSTPTFSVSVENDGEFTESNVVVDITVTAGGKQYKGSHTISTTEPGKTVSAEVPVKGVPLGVPAKVEAAIQPVPGETDHEGTTGTFLAVFGQ